MFAILHTYIQVKKQQHYFHNPPTYPLCQLSTTTPEARDASYVPLPYPLVLAKSNEENRMTFTTAYFQRCGPPSAWRGPCPAWRPTYRACRPGPLWPQCAAGLDVWPRSAGELCPQSWVTREFRLTQQKVHLKIALCETHFSNCT